MTDKDGDPDDDDTDTTTPTNDTDETDAPETDLPDTDCVPYDTDNPPPDDIVDVYSCCLVCEARVLALDCNTSLVVQTGTDVGYLEMPDP